MQFPHGEQQTRGGAPVRLAPPAAPQFLSTFLIYIYMKSIGIMSNYTKGMYMGSVSNGGVYMYTYITHLFQIHV